MRQQPIRGIEIEVIRIEGRTPVLFIDIPGASEDVVLLYGHYDKQPEFTGWDDDLDPGNRLSKTENSMAVVAPTMAMQHLDL